MAEACAWRRLVYSGGWSIVEAGPWLRLVHGVTRASVGEWGLSRTKVCSGAVGVLRVAMSGSRQGMGRGRDLR